MVYFDCTCDAYLLAEEVTDVDVLAVWGDDNVDREMSVHKSHFVLEAKGDASHHVLDVGADGAHNGQFLVSQILHKRRKSAHVFFSVDADTTCG